jgi:hypothetical protein
MLIPLVYFYLHIVFSLENYCTQNQVYTGVLRHPYHCNMFVGCHSGQVSGVPAGCAQGNCFHETTCYPCETIGGCSVTGNSRNLKTYIICGFGFRIKIDHVYLKDYVTNLFKSFLNGLH